MSEHQALPQVRVISRERTLEDAAALSVISPSPEHTAKLIATIRQYAEELQAARIARYGPLLASAIGAAD